MRRAPGTPEGFGGTGARNATAPTRDADSYPPKSLVRVARATWPAISGFSFSLAESLPGLDAGTQFDSVKLILGDCEMRGEILVMHVTHEPESAIVCGALFYPANDAELLKLKGVIAGIETAQSI